MFAKFLEKEILLELGRNLFLLLNAFAAAGYRVKLHDDIRTKDLDKYGRLIYSLDNLALTDALPNDTENWIYLFDKEDRAIGKHPWQKKIRVQYDLFSPYWFKMPVIMPFTPHPVHVTPNLKQRLEKLRSSKKDIRIFFSGDTKGFKRNRVRYPETKLTRSQIVDTTLECMDDRLQVITDVSDLSQTYNGKYLNKCALVDTNVVRVEFKDWLPTLARTEFFLSPPGIVMPMCHNIIEAMAVGAIPITNYPEWFDPNLIHMENCIAFSDQSDLVRKLNQALNMGTVEIARMRANVLEYYKTHLESDTFVRRVESSSDDPLTVLIYTEANMARNPNKLNKNSILMRGTRPVGEEAWIMRLTRRLML